MNLVNSATERAIITNKVGPYLAGCFPDVLPVGIGGKRCLVSTSLWSDGWSRFVDLSMSSHNLRILWRLSEHKEEPNWSHVLYRLRSPTVILTSCAPEAGHMLDAVCVGLSSTDQFDRVVARRRFHKQISQGLGVKLSSALARSSGYIELRSQRVHKLLPNEFPPTLDLSESFISFMFPFRDALRAPREHLDNQVRDRWEKVARNCVRSFVAPNELITRATLLSGLSAAPYFLPARTAKDVVEYAVECGHLHSAKGGQLCLADSGEAAALWDRQGVARDLLKMIDSTRAVDSETAAILSAIRWSFQGNASLNDEMGLLVPTWCKLTKNVHESVYVNLRGECSNSRVVSSLQAMLAYIGRKLKDFDTKCVHASQDYDESRHREFHKNLNEIMYQNGCINKKTYTEWERLIEKAVDVSDGSFTRAAGASMVMEYFGWINQKQDEGDDDDPPAPAPPPAYREGPDWLLSAKLETEVGAVAGTFVEYRKKRSRTYEGKDEIGTWGVDKVGTFRRKVVGQQAAYYIPRLLSPYKEKYSRSISG